MKATELLKQDHKEAMGLIEQLESAGSAGASTEAFAKLKAALTLHTKLEESLLYPALENFDETRDQIRESYKEHKEVDELLVELSTPSDEWQDTLSELKDDIEHHVDEEENEMFPKAEELLGRERLEEMGRQMEEAKRGKPASA
ncbi:MAG TPA: hemerythrin domain-containing protein [Pyrinomonadaceae bacterium]|nr:hemerythrin domain-containing protein [Pyrinomonadaceae bacterium]